jgi:putative transposase
MALPHFQIEGHVYYLTTVVYDRLPIFARPSFVIPLLDSLNYYRYKQQFKLLGYVVMPDHVHFLIWPCGEATVPDFMRDYKEFTAKRIVRQAEVEGIQTWVEAFRQAGLETGRSKNKVWQDGYWDKNVYTERFLQKKLEYVHRNPLRAGLVEALEAYPYSSYRNYAFGEEWLIEVDRDWL